MYQIFLSRRVRGEYLAPGRRRFATTLLVAAVVLADALLAPRMALASPPYAMADCGSCVIDDHTVIHVLANDSPNGTPLDPLSVAVTTPQYGTVLVDDLGDVTYIPQQGFSGTDTFYYTVKNVLGETSNAAQVSVIVQTNMAPTIQFFSASPVSDGWKFSGRVVDETPAGMTVTLSGEPLASPLQVPVNSYGYFEYTQQIVCSGYVTANTVDYYGAAAQERTVPVGY